MIITMKKRNIKRTGPMTAALSPSAIRQFPISSNKVGSALEATIHRATSEEGVELTSTNVLGSVNNDDSDPSRSASLESSPSFVLHLGPFFDVTSTGIGDSLTDSRESSRHGDLKVQTVGIDGSQGGEVSVDQGEGFLSDTKQRQISFRFLTR
jgi:hypothetical protein